MEVGIHGLLSLVYHVQEGLEHVLIHRETHYAPGKAGLWIKVERPPWG